MRKAPTFPARNLVNKEHHRRDADEGDEQRKAQKITKRERTEKVMKQKKA